MNKIRLGILGAGRIVARVMANIHRMEHVEVTAVASRDLRRAQETAARCGAKHAYGSYLELAQSSDVDLVYIATPHTFHEQQAMMMMDHGKHVICEKPMAVNEREASRMIECARSNGVFLMEAMWTRFLPCIMDLVQTVRDGAIGEGRNIFGEFSWSSQAYDPEDRLYNPALAGGGLLDVGVYPLMMCMQLLGNEPEMVQSLCRKSKEGVDLNTSVQMQYANGAVAQFFCGMDACGDEPRDMRHVYHQVCADGMRNVGETLEIDRPGICRGARNDQLWLMLKGKGTQLFIIDEAVGGNSVGNEVVQLSRGVDRGSVGQVTAFCQGHSHDGISGVEDGSVRRHVCLSARVGLYVCVLSSEELLCTLAGDIFHNINVLATAVITVIGIAFRILIGQNRAHSSHDCGGNVVFRCDQLDVVLLTAVLQLHGSGNLGIKLRNKFNGVKVTFVHWNPPRKQ